MAAELERDTDGRGEGAAVGTVRPLVAVLALTVLGTVLRLPGLGAKSYWLDELGTVDVLDFPFTELANAVAERQNTPPLYYLLAWPWAQVFGTSEIGLRSLSTVFSVALIPIAYLIGRRLLSERVGIIAAALVAVNPMLVWYGQDAKAYALLALLAGISFLLFLRALDHATVWRLVAWGVCGGLAVATHYFAVFLVVVEGAWLLWRVRPRRIALLGVAFPLLACLALWPLVRSQGTPDWVGGLSLFGRITQTLPFFIVGFETPAPYAVAAVGALFCGLGLWLLLFRSSACGRRRGLLAVGISAASIAVALVGKEYFLYRNVIGSLLPLLVGLACGFGAARAGRLGVAAASSLCVLSAGVVLVTAHTPKFGKEDWRDAAKAVGRGDGRARVVVVTPRYGRSPLAYYLGDGTRRVEDPNAAVTEIVVVEGATRRPGSTTAARPPRGPARPGPKGFVIETQVAARYFTVVTYRASAPQRVLRAELLALARRDDAELLLRLP